MDIWSEAGAGTEIMSDDSGIIRILTVDDHALLRSGIAGLVNAEPDMKMIAEAATGVEAIKPEFRS